MDESVTDRLQDILDVCDELTGSLAGMTLVSFAKDRDKQRVAERLLEIAGEAANNLPDAILESIPGDWANLRKLRLLLAHAYHRVELQPLWEAATTSLPRLGKAIRDAFPDLE